MFFSSGSLRLPGVTRAKSLASVFLLSAAFLGTTPKAIADNKKPSAPAPKAAAPKAPAAAAKPSTGASASHTTGATTAGHTTGTTTAGHTTTTTTTAGHTTTGTTTAGRTTTTTAGGAKTTTTTSTKTTANPVGGGGAKATSATSGGGKAGPGAASRTTAPVHTAGGPAGRAPTGSHEVHTANGSTVRTRANGQRADVHDARRGMDIHHGLNGNRRVSVERADHSRVFAERGGRGYVQHPYRYGGREYGRRTYYDHGRYYDHYYGRHYYHGEYVDVYAPARFYSVGFYGWAYNPWVAPINYSWGWGGSPWYGYYGAYFTPYPVYPSAAFWLTDYLFSVSLQAAYAAAAANAEANAIAASNPPPPLSPDVKQMVADEVKSQLALENAEAAANAQNQASDPASSSIERMLSDGKPHVFIAGGDLDLVDANGQECPISQGDVVEVPSPPAADATAATALVVASKGGKECARSTNVNIAFTDLQDMQNHLRETIDTGMGDLQAKQGKGGLPAAPPSATTPPVASAITAAAPPPDTNASAEIAEQSKTADQAEQEIASAAPVPPGPSDQSEVATAPAPSSAAPATIALGQTIDQVTGSFGQPLSVRDLGTKKVYVYKDMKVTFKAGKVTDIE